MRMEIESTLHNRISILHESFILSSISIVPCDGEWFVCFLLLATVSAKPDRTSLQKENARKTGVACTHIFEMDAVKQEEFHQRFDNKRQKKRHGKT